MDTMIRTFFRHLLESIKSLKRNGWMTIASISAVTITLTVVGIFLAVILNAQKIASDVEKDVNVTVFVDIGTDQKEIDKLQGELKGLKGVTSVKFSSKADELKKIEDAMGSEWKLFQGDSNPLYDVFVVSTDSPKSTEKVAGEAKKLDNVYKADFGGASSKKIFAIADGIKKWGTIGAALLLFVAVFLISNTIRITILSRQREIQIMRLVGAKNGYIRWPFFLEGAWIGLLGAIVPILILVFAYRFAYQNLNPQLLTSNYSMLAPSTFIFEVSLGMAAIGVVIGSLGSVISMRRFLKV
jgi:cell division transport system permease protein